MLPDKAALSKTCECFTWTMKTVAKKHIPKEFRSSYIPTWEDECPDLYRIHEEAQDLEEIKDVATKFSNRLNEKQ